MLWNKDSATLFLNYEKFTGTEEEFLAVKDFDCKEWSLHGWLHRIDGPAIIRRRNEMDWYIEGHRYWIFFNSFFPMTNYIKDKYPGE